MLASGGVASAPNGITLPKNYKDRKVLSSSFRKDNGTIRIIVGNDTATAAAPKGATNPWSESSTLGKIIRKQSVYPNGEDAIVPGKFVHSEFMVKDSVRYKDTGGWGYARWIGMEKEVYKGDGQSYFECHAAVEDNDYVFTHPAKLP